MADTEEEGTCSCVGCDQDFEYSLGYLADGCGCLYCPQCLEKRFRSSLNDNSFPPRCCEGALPFKSVKAHLPADLVQKIQKNILELTTKHKLYCHNPTCSAFIAPYHIHNNDGYCQKCRAITCAKCREKEHFGPSTGFFERLKVQHGFQQCRKCGCMVEKISGCNHMYCSCGTGFCYECGALEAEGCDCVYVDPEDEELYEYDLEDERPRNGEEEAALAAALRAARIEAGNPYNGQEN